jgi:hypothetical protein
MYLRDEYLLTPLKLRMRVLCGRDCPPWLAEHTMDAFQPYFKQLNQLVCFHVRLLNFVRGVALIDLAAEELALMSGQNLAKT